MPVDWGKTTTYFFEGSRTYYSRSIAIEDAQKLANDLQRSITITKSVFDPKKNSRQAIESTFTVKPKKQKNPAKGKWIKVKAVKFLGNGKVQVMR